MEASRVAEESGPDEDHQTVRKHKLLKVVEMESNKPPEILWNSGVFEVTSDDPVIDKFLNDVPFLIEQDKTHGLIWSKSLQPADCRYNLGEHYLSTREAERKSMQGTVSFYRDGVTGVKFAIKTLAKNAFFRADEIKVTLKEHHPNICSVYGIIVRDGHVHILLEHAGAPLTDERAWIAETPDRMLSLARQSFQALEVVHGWGYVHCDIKPDNIMIVREGNEFTVKLIDFGSCHHNGAVLPYDTHTTLEYWSPEVWQALDTKSQIICQPGMDVYAVALTLYFVQTSAHLMQRLGGQAMKDVMTKSPDDLLFIALPEEISSDLRAVMKQCLSGRPESRLGAAQAVKQLTDDVVMQSPAVAADDINYKDSFQRICSSLHEAAAGKPGGAGIDRGTVFQVPSGTLNFTQLLPETPPIQYFIGSSKGIEKRELKSVTKARKTNCSTGSKLSKPRSKGKKSVKISSKLCPSNMPKPYTEITGKVVPMSDLSPEKSSETKSEEKAYPCSTVLKNLALRVQPNPGKMVQSLQRPVSGTEKPTLTSVTKDMKRLDGTSCERLEAHRQPMQTTHNTVKENLREQVEWAPIVTGDDAESGTREKDKGKGSREMMDEGTNGKFQQQSSTEKTDIVINPLVDSQITAPPEDVEQVKAAKDISKDPVSRSTEDDMEFVLSAFDDNLLTGGDDGIIDNWMRWLDNDDDNAVVTAESNMEVSISQVPKNANRTLEVEPMELGNDQEVATSRTGITSKPDIIIRQNRKRMTTSAENSSGIPGKAACLSPVQQPASKYQLPDFDQILPENV